MTIKQQGGIFGRNPTFNETTSTTSNTDALYVTDKAGINATSSQIPALTRFQIGSVGSGSDATYSGRLKLDDQPASLQQGGGLEFMTSTFGSGYGWKVSSISSSGVHLVIGTRQNSADWTEVARFNSSGNLAFPSGQGIDFSATSGTGTSELFDDYEEGNWTPTLIGLTSGSASITTVSVAKYVKIGRSVTIFTQLSGIRLDTDNISGNVAIGGLPFASSTVSSVASFTFANILSADETTNTISGYVQSSQLLLRKGSSLTAITDSDLDSVSNGTFMVSATYQV